MRFPHDLTLYPAIPDPSGADRLVPDLDNPVQLKGFILPGRSSEPTSIILREMGQRSVEEFTCFLPPTTPAFNTWAQIDWTSSNVLQGGSFEVRGEPEAYGNTTGRVHHIQLTLRRVN